MPREAEGWRQGRPVEDPEKTKRWGFITAKPSEYLIHMRRGKVRRRSTGQGASCFKWPWDSVAIIPTSINRLHFTADQVTREKVGVSVTGLAVYRIVEPEITFRMLNFSFSERASEKLAEILREMFVGAVRRHVANLSVEHVIAHRKEAIAGELMKELAPVVSGRGRAEDSTAGGWGVVLDSVEVQDVRVLSEHVFRDMQAVYRAELAMRAREAELSSAQAIATREASASREMEEAKIASEVAIREMKAHAESRSTQTEIAEESKRAALKAKTREEEAAREHARRLANLREAAELQAERARQEEAARLEAIAREQRRALEERALIETRHQSELREAELAALLAARRAEDEAALAEGRSVAEGKIRERHLALERLANEVAAGVARAQREVDNLISDERIRLTLAQEALPALAGAFAQKIGEVRLTQIGGDAADPSAMIARGIGQAIEVARAFGLGIGAPAAVATPSAPPPPAKAKTARSEAAPSAPLGRPQDDDE
ncbi:MAG: hypothetical protein H6711_04675 [Myxococcales bacterium]|nr:hypothetical protein [Myxococcales bacterium]